MSELAQDLEDPSAIIPTKAQNDTYGSDSEDEAAPDFSQLTALANRMKQTIQDGQQDDSSRTNQQFIPKRGEKDFEPNPTLLQSDILAASRDAMYTAISHPRIHPPKSLCVGIYAPEGPTPLAGFVKSDDNDALPSSSAGAKSTTTHAVKNLMAGISPDVCVCIPQPKGILFKTMGKSDRWNRVSL